MKAGEACPTAGLESSLESRRSVSDSRSSPEPEDALLSTTGSIMLTPRDYPAGATRTVGLGWGESFVDVVFVS